MSILSSPLLVPLLGIIKDGMSIWSEERRTRFMKKHHEILKELEDAENEIYPDYTDARVDLADERLCIFVEAYGSELRKANMEILQQREGQA